MSGWKMQRNSRRNKKQKNVQRRKNPAPESGVDPVLRKLLNKYDGLIEPNIVQMVYDEAHRVENTARHRLEAMVLQMGTDGLDPLPPSPPKEPAAPVKAPTVHPAPPGPAKAPAPPPKPPQFQDEDFVAGLDDEYLERKNKQEEDALDLVAVDEKFGRFRRAVPEDLLDSTVLQMILDENKEAPESAVIKQIEELVGFEPEVEAPSQKQKGAAASTQNSAKGKGKGGAGAQKPPPALAKSVAPPAQPKAPQNPPLAKSVPLPKPEPAKEAEVELSGAPDGPKGSNAPLSRKQRKALRQHRLASAPEDDEASSSDSEGEELLTNRQRRQRGAAVPSYAAVASTGIPPAPPSSLPQAQPYDEEYGEYDEEYYDEEETPGEEAEEERKAPSSWGGAPVVSFEHLGSAHSATTPPLDEERLNDEQLSMVQFLSTMFPEFDRQTLIQALLTNDNSVELTVDAILPVLTNKDSSQMSLLDMSDLDIDQATAAVGKLIDLDFSDDEEDSDFWSSPNAKKADDAKPNEVKTGGRANLANFGSDAVAQPNEPKEHVDEEPKDHEEPKEVEQEEQNYGEASEFEEQMDALKNLFPTLTDSQRADYLLKYKFDLATTVDKLLNMGIQEKRKAAPKREKTTMSLKDFFAVQDKKAAKANDWESAKQEIPSVWKGVDAAPTPNTFDLATQLKWRQIVISFPEVEEESLMLSTFVENRCQVLPTLKALCNFGLKPSEDAIAFMERPPAPVKPKKPAQPKAAAPRPAPQGLPKYGPLRTSAYHHSAPLNLDGEDTKVDVDSLLRMSMDFAEMRNQVFRQAARSYQSGNGRVASELSRKGREYEERMRQTNILAARKLFYTSRLIIDLHGLEVNSALDLLDELLELHRTNFQQYNGANNQQVLKIITGVGNHSEGGRAKLRPAVKKFLIAHGWNVSEANPGMFHVSIRN